MVGIIAEAAARLMSVKPAEGDKAIDPVMNRNNERNTAALDDLFFVIACVPSVGCSVKR